MLYKVVLKQSEEGFSVHCPGLLGCWSQGVTEEDALNNIREAIPEYLDTIDGFTVDQVVRQVEIAV